MDIDRNSAEEKYRWDLNAIYKSEEDYKKDLDKVIKEINIIKEYEKLDIKDSNNLYMITKNIEETYRLFTKIYIF